MLTKNELIFYYIAFAKRKRKIQQMKTPVKELSINSNICKHVALEIQRTAPL